MLQVDGLMLRCRESDNSGSRQRSFWAFAMIKSGGGPKIS
jgi:hypothetical protein